MAKKIAKHQALKDMAAVGIDVSVFHYERIILTLTATEASVRIDFRKFNGGAHPKKK